VLYYYVQLSLFFTLFSSLASGQWRSDQFLFNKSSQEARLKAKTKKKIVLTQKDSKTNEPTGQISEATLTTDGNSKNESLKSEDTKYQKRGIASLESQPPITLDLKFGAMDVSSKSQMNGMNFSQSTYSFSGVLNIPVQEIDDASFFYTSTTEIRTGSNSNARWEDWGGSYKREFTVLDQKLNFGLLLRQYSWWRTNDNSDYSLKSINGFGVCGSFIIPTKGLWRAKVGAQVLPILSNERGSLRGVSTSIDWVSYYQLTSGRALLVNIGYEWIDLKNKTNSQYNLNQNLLKMSIGYQFSNSQ